MGDNRRDKRFVGLRAAMALIAGAALLAGALAGCDDEAGEPESDLERETERAADELQEAGRATGEALEEAGERLGEELERGQEKAGEMLEDAGQALQRDANPPPSTRPAERPQ